MAGYRIQYSMACMEHGISDGADRKQQMLGYGRRVFSSSFPFVIISTTWSPCDGGASGRYVEKLGRGVRASS